MNDRQEALNFVSGFLAGFYHQTWDYEKATLNARAHIEQYPHVKEEITNAFQNVLAADVSFPPNTFLTLMREDANRYVYDEADARTFLQELYQDVISDNGFAQHHDNHDVNLLDDEDEDEEDDPFLSFTPVGEPNIPQLMAELENGDTETRSQAIVALVMSGDLAVVEPLIALLENHSDAQGRLAAIQVLWRLGDMRALAPLIATLKGDEDSYVRRVAAYALGQLGNQGAIEPLIAAFSDEIKGVGITASLALAELGACTVDPLLALLYQGDEHSEYVEDALRMMNDNEAIHPLLALLKESDSRLRAVAAMFLMHFDDERVIQPLQEALQDPDEEVRHYARLSLGVLRGPSAYQSYTQMKSVNHFD